VCRKHIWGSFTCQEGTLDAIRPIGLRPHGDHDGVVGVAQIKEGDAVVAEITNPTVVA
jgi:hypothetical protein